MQEPVSWNWNDSKRNVFYPSLDSLSEEHIILTFSGVITKFWLLNRENHHSNLLQTHKIGKIGDITNFVFIYLWFPSSFAPHDASKCELDVSRYKSFSTSCVIGFAGPMISLDRLTSIDNNQNIYLKQECIPVGCVPPAHWPHLVVSAGGLRTCRGACVPRGVHAWGAWVPGECACPGGVHTPPADRILDTHLWKHYLPACGR